MFGKTRTAQFPRGRKYWMGALALLTATGFGAAGFAQEQASPVAPPQVMTADQAKRTTESVVPATGGLVVTPDGQVVDTSILPAGCKSCESSVVRHQPNGRRFRCNTCDEFAVGRYEGCAPCGQCIPGREPCCGCDDSWCGRLWGGFYECVCCPDPCYEPRWVAAANSAFFTDGARPVTQTKFRWDHGYRVELPDRSEFLLARSGGKGPNIGGARLELQELSMVTEAAVGAFSMYVIQPYREIDTGLFHGSGFGDLKIGTKSLLLDCELLQFAFQFETTIPSGSPGEGAGVGHTALDPSLLFAIKLARETYVQMQMGDWLPIGGDKLYQGSIFHWGVSVNHAFDLKCGLQLVPSAECFGYTFQGGAYTDPAAGTLRSNGESYAYAGGGLRLVICDKIDFGFGAAVHITAQHFADQLYRAELRWRF